MAFHLSESSKFNRRTAHPDLITVSDLAITITRVDFGHGRLSAARTASQQNRLFQDGFSQCDGFEKLSYHQVRDDVHSDLPELSEALDFYAWVDGKTVWTGEPMVLIACAFLQAGSILGVPLESGVLWGWDYPHIQLANAAPRSR